MFSNSSAIALQTGEELLCYVQNGQVKEATKTLVEYGTEDPKLVDFQDSKTGNTALRYAVIAKSEVLVKLMIVFNADLNIVNHQKKTALDLAQEEGEAAIAKDISTIRDLEKDLNGDEEKAMRSAKRDPDEALLLSLDGGGIRGLVFIQVLIEMEKRRMKLYPESKPLLSQFNWVTGNSAGGISALALVGPGVDEKRGRQLFFTLKDEVLGGEPPIPNEQVDGVFQKVYGKIYGNNSAVMTDIKGRKVSIMTTLCNQCPPLLHIMSNYGGCRHEGTEPPEKQLIWKAARATSSVPVFFHPQDECYLDGGLIANNPTCDGIIDMYDYAKKENKKVELKLVLSLGTGLNLPKPIDDVDFHASVTGKVIAYIANYFGKRKIGTDLDELFTVAANPKAFVELMEVVSSQITQPNGEVLRRGEFLSEELGAKYYRINPTIADIDFLTTDDKELIDMLYSVIKYVLENCRQQIDPVLDFVYGQ